MTLTITLLVSIACLTLVGVGLNAMTNTFTLNILSKALMVLGLPGIFGFFLVVAGISGALSATVAISFGIILLGVFSLKGNDTVKPVIL